MSHPRTDIICLAHNQLKITKGFVQDLFQNTEDFHLIFVNNNSTDGTAEYLDDGRRDGKWQVIDSSTNLGIIKARNLGVNHAEADYFVHIDNDQYPQKGWLESLFALRDKGYDICGPEAWALLPPHSPSPVMVRGKPLGDRSYYPFKHCNHKNNLWSYIGCGGMLVKRKICDDVGLFDERFSPAYFEDPDFCFRCVQGGYRMAWRYDCPIKHLAHQTIPNQKLFDKHSQFNKSREAFIKKWKPYFPKLQRAIDY